MSYIVFTVIVIYFTASIFCGLDFPVHLITAWKNRERVKKVFGVTIKQLREKPQILEQGDYKIRKIGLLVQHLDNKRELRRLNPKSITRYESFIINTEGEIHILEIGENNQNIEANAEWIASILNVPFEDS